LITGWFATTDYIQKNRSVVERFARIIGEAAAYTNRHHAETLDALAAFSGMDPANLAGMTRSVIADSLDKRDIQPLVDTAARYKVIDHSFDAQELIGLSSARGS
jgi:ABC-type nitrate/sulfonate/bicarbonate transport system substrate-binding protein